jgi:hypothetical protein
LEFGRKKRIKKIKKKRNEIDGKKISEKSVTLA